MIETLAGMLAGIGSQIHLANLWRGVFDPEASGVGTFYWRNVVLYLVLAAAFYAWHARKNGESMNIRRLGALLFPRELYRQRSVRLDAQLYVADLVGVRRVLQRAIILPLVVTAIIGVVVGAPGGGGTSTGSISLARGLALVVAAFLASELAYYAIHRIVHATPVLWQFHRAHHYARQLTPLAGVRIHPVDDALLTGGYVLAGALATRALAGADAPMLAASGAAYAMAAIAFLDDLNDRFNHSHVPIRYGHAIESVVVSPVLHHVHHSFEPHHWDKNFGNVLSLFDWMFGTLYRPRSDESMRWGVAEEGWREYTGLADFYVRPFKEAWAVMVGRFSQQGGPTMKQLDSFRAKAFWIVLSVVTTAVSLWPVLGHAGMPIRNHNETLLREPGR